MEYFEWINATRKTNFRAKVRPFWRVIRESLLSRGYDPRANSTGCFC